MTHERLSPDPSVAVVGYRFTSTTRGPKVKHDVALLVHEDGSTGWDCSCESAVLGGRECHHIRTARVLYAAERRTARGGE